MYKSIYQRADPSNGGSAPSFEDVIQTVQKQMQRNSIVSRDAILSGLLFSLTVSLLLFVAFCLLRTRHNAVYAPRVKQIHSSLHNTTISAASSHNGLDSSSVRSSSNVSQIQSSSEKTGYLDSRINTPVSPFSPQDRIPSATNQSARQHTARGQFARTHDQNSNTSFPSRSNSYERSEKIRDEYGDSDMKPPAVNKGFFGWLTVVFRLSDQQMVQVAGLDAALYIAFIRTMTIVTVILSIFGCAILIPLNLRGSRPTAPSKLKFVRALGNSPGGTEPPVPQNVAAQPQQAPADNPFIRMSIQGVHGSWLWSHVMFAYIFSAILMIALLFLWHRAIALRQQFLNSGRVQRSIHGRALLISDIPADARSENGLRMLVSSLKGYSAPACSISRGLGDISRSIKTYKETLKDLESVLARYLAKYEHNLATQRPMRTIKEGEYAGQRVDAISFLQERLNELEVEIISTRKHYRTNNPERFGFAMYATVDAAQRAARLNKNRSIDGAHVAPAPESGDILWQNLAQSRSRRAHKFRIGNLLLLAITIAWFVPSALISTFLANISNIAYLSPSFKTALEAHSKFFAAVQGIVAPLLISLFFMVLPIIFRRISIWQGYFSKTARERAVLHKLYFFFFTNNFLIFTLFQVLYTLITQVVYAQRLSHGSSWWTMIKQFGYAQSFSAAILNTSTFWIIYIVQRYMTCLLDLAQLSQMFLLEFNRLFYSVTPRQRLEYLRPPQFFFSVYFNVSLFYLTIAVTYSIISPLVLPFTGIYFVLAFFTYKYGLMYVTETRHESGGFFWKIAFNRICFAMCFATVVHCVVVFIRSQDSKTRPICIAPIFFLWIMFKVYVWAALEPKFNYISSSIGNSSSNMERAYGGVDKAKTVKIPRNFGHPLLEKPLPVLMIDSKYEHLLGEVLNDTFVCTMTPGNAHKKKSKSSVNDLADEIYLSDINSKRPDLDRDNSGVYGSESAYSGSDIGGYGLRYGMQVPGDRGSLSVQTHFPQHQTPWAQTEYEAFPSLDSDTYDRQWSSSSINYHQDSGMPAGPFTQARNCSRSNSPVLTVPRHSFDDQISLVNHPNKRGPGKSHLRRDLS